MMSNVSRRQKGLVVMEFGGLLAVVALYQHRSAGLWLITIGVVALVAWVRGWQMMFPEEDV